MAHQLVHELATNSDNGLWRLPEEWQWRPVSFAATDTERRDPGKKADEIFRYVDISAIDNEKGAIDIDKVRELLGNEAPSRARKVIRTGDILFATTRPSLRNIALVPKTLDNQVCSTGFCVLRAKRDIAIPEWLYYASRSSFFVNQLVSKQRGAAYPAVNDVEVYEALIPIPYPDQPQTSLALQRAIVERIESLLAELNECYDLLADMRRKANLLLESAFEEVYERVRPSSQLILLGDVATAENGRASGEGNSLTRVFKTKHVYPHTVRQSQPSFAKEEQVYKFPASRYLQSSDVLMANIAEGTLGRVSFVADAEPNWTVDTQIMIMRSKDRNVLIGKWLYYFLWSRYGQAEIMSRRTGIAFAEKRGQTHIYPDNIKEIPILLPDTIVQEQVVAYLDSVLAEEQLILGHIEEDEQRFVHTEQSIMERAFRGEL